MLVGHDHRSKVKVVGEANIPHRSRAVSSCLCSQHFLSIHFQVGLDASKRTFDGGFYRPHAVPVTQPTVW